MGERYKQRAASGVWCSAEFIIHVDDAVAIEAKPLP